MSRRQIPPRRYTALQPLPASGPAELATRLSSLPVGASAAFGWDDRHAQHVATITRLSETEYRYVHDGVDHSEMTGTADRAALALSVQVER